MSEPAAGEPPFLPDGVPAGFLLLQGLQRWLRCCGWSVARSGPISPRRRQSLMAWLEPGIGGVGVCPWSMCVRRWHLLLRLQQRPACDGAPPVHRGARLLLRRRRVRVLLVREGSRGAVVIFSLLRVLCVVWQLQLSFYPPCMFLYFYMYLYVILN